MLKWGGGGRDKIRGTRIPSAVLEKTENISNASPAHWYFHAQLHISRSGTA